MHRPEVPFVIMDHQVTVVRVALLLLVQSSDRVEELIWVTTRQLPNETSSVICKAWVGRVIQR